MTIQSAVFILASVFIPAALATDVAVVPSVDLNRYVGRWYEIATIPQFFQRRCVGDVSAEYTAVEPGRIKVVNECRQADGSISSAEGRAKVVDPSEGAKLQVTFVKLIWWVYAFGGDYWIIDLDPSYRFAVIGHPKRKYGWILSRTPQINKSDLFGIEERLREQGYDTCQFLMTGQGGKPETRLPLCRYVEDARKTANMKSGVHR